MGTTAEAEYTVRHGNAERNVTASQALPILIRASRAVGAAALVVSVVFTVIVLLILTAL